MLKIINITGLYSFFYTIGANDRGYGHLAVCVRLTVAQRQSECGRKTC